MNTNFFTDPEILTNSLNLFTPALSLKEYEYINHCAKDKISESIDTINNRIAILFCFVFTISDLDTQEERSEVRYQVNVADYNIVSNIWDIEFNKEYMNNEVTSVTLNDNILTISNDIEKWSDRYVRYPDTGWEEIIEQ